MVRETLPEEGLESDLELGIWRAFQEGKVGSKFTDVKKKNGVLGSQQTVKPGEAHLCLGDLILEAEGSLFSARPLV